MAVQSVTVMPRSPARGFASVQCALVLFEGATGRIGAVIDSALVTRWKTRGDSVLGAQLLARREGWMILEAYAIR